MTNPNADDAATADHALKAKHRAMWAQGDYPSIAADLIAGLGPLLVQQSGVGPGQRVLDVAAGTGNASIPAALTGAEVVASDLTPELLEVGRALAAERGVEVEWREADAERLPFGDAEFDVVLSVVGIMFAPHHQAAADELLRVSRPGGTIGLIAWTPEGFLGKMLAVMKPFMPPLPPGAQPPPLWGREEHVRELLGDRVGGLSAERRELVVDAFASPEEFRDYFRERYGPTIAAYRAIGDDPDRIAQLDRGLADLAREHDRGEGDGLVMDWEFLMITATRGTDGTDA
ncbi:class I SAM-dependent methyltransferase [Streptomyces sp. NPDC056600]|uniref:class I SAM-dependent methyltransferase n=1 Tax=Streptomyces sp. NPDC056600 TaxID=3345874 RepID=UPI003696F88B